LSTLLTNREPKLAKSQIIQILDAICQSIEPTETQYQDAAQRYDTIGKFLAEEGSPLYQYDPIVYPQGSMRIKAAIRPLYSREFDVDLVCEFRKMPHMDPKIVKQLVWDRFQLSDRYKSMTVEKNRCVQIQYAGDFHMDVMPCIPGVAHWVQSGSVWVPDKQMEDWKPSNPTGFAGFIETAAAKAPRHLALFANRVEAKAAEVQPLDVENTFTKPALIRIIQLLKRHRDEHFKTNHAASPISVIITTLATHSYDRAVDQNYYDSVYDLMLDVVQGMLAFIIVDQQRAQYCIPNPSHPQENFAEKWNTDPKLPDAFFNWHKRVIGDLKSLAEQEARGLDKVAKVVENSFGTAAANQAVRSLSSSFRDMSGKGLIGVTPAGFVVPTGVGIRTVTKSPHHNNFGS
jgi:hypothetical protein